MKKLYTLALGLIATCTFGQLTENFDAAVALPAGWTSFVGANGEGTSYNWSVVASTRAYSAGNCAYVRYEVVTTIAEDWLVTPLVDLTNYANVNMSFWGGQQYTADYGTEYTIRVSTTSQTDINSFTTIETYTEADFATTTPISSQKTVDLSAYNGQQIYIAFVMTQNDGDNWFIDDVSVTGTLNTASFNNNSVASVYPNPTKGLITVANEENIQSIEIYGILGNLIKTVSRTNKVDMGELASGSYMIKIKTDQGAVRTEKVIKS